MIKLEHVVLASAEQMEFIIEGMRNPMNSWGKSDSGVCLKTLPCHSCHENRNNCEMNKDAGFVLGDNDRDLMQSLSNAGTDHRKYMRMMPVYVRITAPLYWWKEFDTYKVGTVANSCSTMHKIQEKEFMLEDFSTEHLLGFDGPHNDERKVPYLSINHDDISPLGIYKCGIIPMLNICRKIYLETKSKTDWWQMIQLLPSSYNQTRNVMLNYEVLANIYHARKNHKLDEWRKFCKWIETLPYSELITGLEKRYQNGFEAERSMNREDLREFKIGDKVKYTNKASINFEKEGYISGFSLDHKIAHVTFAVEDSLNTVTCFIGNLELVE